MNWTKRLEEKIQTASQLLEQKQAEGLDSLAVRLSYISLERHLRELREQLAQSASNEQERS